MKNNAFSRLREQLGLPESTGPDSLDSTDQMAPHTRAVGATRRTLGPSKAVVRMERSGRGGKEATVVEQLGLPTAELEEWLKALKTELGCGGSVEGDALMLQGDHRKRLPKALAGRGVRRIIVG